jgi:homoserine kinase type II
MAVYTSVSDTQLSAFLEHYDAGEAISFKGIAEGVENSNYLLRTTRATYILTLYEKRVAEADLPFFLGLMVHLSSRGMNTPVTIAGKDGALYRELNGRPAALISFLDGVSVSHPEVDHCRQLGSALARFHIASIGFDLTRANSLGQKDWRALFEKCRERADEVETGLAALIDKELEKLDAIWPSHLPRGIIHADLFPDNVFFLGQDFSGIIDPYFACEDMLAYDLAICINAWCFEDDGPGAVSFDKAKARAMISGYSQVRPFSELELDGLPLLCRGAALRFLLTRLHDWLFHPDGALVEPKSPQDFVERLKFHAAITGPSDYGLS